MSERTPARDTYDVEIDVRAGTVPTECIAGVLVKLTYRIDVRTKRLEPGPALPLENDVRDDSLEPRLPPHTDFWFSKPHPDVGVIGSAFAPNRQPVDRMYVAAQVADRRKVVEVFGDRFVEWTASGRPRVGAPEPFTEMPLEHARSYGGIDFRVPFDDADPRARLVTFESDHPGWYPRNPWGKGYLAVPEPVEGMALPNLENPDDRLTDDRLIANPESWYVQPVPWYLDWTPVNCYPRNMFYHVDCDPWFPPPDDERLTEVRWGMLPSGYRTAWRGQPPLSSPRPGFRQEASHGWTFREPPFGAPLRIEGMHPESPVVQCALPSVPPRLDVTVEGHTESVEPELTTVAIYPDRELVTLTFAARRPTPRPFFPGIHKRIPVSVSVDGDTPVHYEAPVPVRERLRAAQEAYES